MKKLFVLMIVGMCAQSFCMDRGVTPDTAAQRHVWSQEAREFLHQFFVVEGTPSEREAQRKEIDEIIDEVIAEERDELLKFTPEELEAKRVREEIELVCMEEKAKQKIDERLCPMLMELQLRMGQLAGSFAYPIAMHAKSEADRELIEAAFGEALDVIAQGLRKLNDTMQQQLDRIRTFYLGK